MYLLTGLGTTALATAIFRQEGVVDASGNWIPGSLGYRLNNPGNLNYAGQPGCHPTTMGNGLEAQCDTMDIGITATENQLALDASRGLTLAQRLNTWATGNKAAYVANVSDWLGVPPDTPLSALVGGGSPSAASIPPGLPADSSPTFDSSLLVDTSGTGLSTGAMVGLGIAAAALLYMAVG